MEELIEIVCKTVAKYLECDINEINADTRIYDDLDMDAVDVIGVIILIEEKFDAIIDVPTVAEDDNFNSVRTIRDLAEHMMKFID